MINETLKWYKIYEYIRDNNDITEKMSNTKRLLIKLMQDDREIQEFCNKKILEEKQEVEDAKAGIHFHPNMTKREILVNEISQYIYWLTIIAVSQNISYEEFDVENKIKEILSNVDIKIIGETEPITLDEIIIHDLNEMRNKEYLSEVIE